MTITFLPSGVQAEVSHGETLLTAAERAGVLIDAACGGAVKCGKCKVRISKGAVSPLTDVERELLFPTELALGFRLACCTTAQSDLELIVDDRHGGSTRKKSMAKLPDTFRFAPAVTLRTVTVPRATMDNQTDALNRLRTALDLPMLMPAAGALSDVQKAIDAKRGKVTAVLRGNELITLLGGEETACYGVAFDIGTTTVVGTLWNLADGSAVANAARTNDQSVFGADVISRIQFSMAEEGNLALLQKKVLFTLESILTELCLTAEISPAHIYDVTVVGNTTMSHLFLAVSPKPLSRTPFAPVFTEAQVLPASALALPVHPRAAVHLLPNIAGHVGSDITAMMLAAEIDQLQGNHVAIDIGTNGEVVAVCGGKLVCCSTAAGPAFEGACIRSGMRAAAGAIERVDLVDDDISIAVIDDAAPLGLCGSGLIDTIAALLHCGALLPSGRLLTKDEAVELPPAISARMVEENGAPAFLLAKSADGTDILLTQQDIREVQLAKGAILAGIQTLLQEHGISEDELDSVLLAGAFGNYIRRESALAIGLLPAVSMEKIIPIGNAAGAGASMALLSTDERQRAAKLADAARHVELSMNEVFQEFYISAMQFGT